MKKTRYPGIFELPDGRFRLRTTAMRLRTGKLKEGTKTLAPGTSIGEAMVALEALKTKLRQGGESMRTNKRLSVDDYAVRWLEDKAARVRPAVAGQYEYTLGNFILPKLGDLYVDAVTRADVERWVAWAERQTKQNGQHYAKDSVHSWWRVLAAMLRDATAELQLPMDPTYRVRPPRTRVSNRRERRTLSAVELGQLLAQVKQHSPDRYAEIYVLAYTGMRAGELFVLEWDDIDQEKGLIHVRRSVWRGQVSDPKTNDPRDVALTEEMGDVLREHRLSLIAAQHPGLETSLVFPADNGAYRTPSCLHKPLAKAATKASIDVKVAPHVLRRTFNTLMVHAGVDRIVLRSQMGHCSEEMTQRYSGVSGNAKREAVMQLVELTRGR